MKTLTLTLFLFITLISLCQNEIMIEQSLLKNINEYRISKNLGEFTSSQESNKIAEEVYKVFGTVEPMMLLNQIGVDKDWAIYMVEGYVFNLLKNTDNSIKVGNSIKSYIADTLRVKNTEWYNKNNIGKDKPYLFGIYVTKIKEDKFYETYKLFFVTLKNTPMEYKCFRPVEN